MRLQRIPAYGGTPQNPLRLRGPRCSAAGNAHMVPGQCFECACERVALLAVELAPTTTNLSRVVRACHCSLHGYAARAYSCRAEQLTAFRTL